MKNINKISIIGGSGCGKTTLSDNIGKALDLPVCHIDGIHHLDNWVVRDKDERDKMIMEKVAEEKWVIDGTYRSTLNERLENSDLVIYLDYSSIAQVKGALGRWIKHHGEEKPDIPGCKEKMDLKFLSWVWNWRKDKRQDVVEVVNKLDDSKVLIFKNRRELNKWYEKEFGKKIEV